MRVLYRVRQLAAELRPARPVEQAHWVPHLNPAQRTLFESMPPAEQQHGCKVLHLVQREGYREPALAQAALLHDVGRVLPVVRQGKVLPVVRQGTRPQVRVWHRVAAVLLRAIHPRLVCAVAFGSTGSWRYPFWILLHHAAIGAELAAEANTDPLAVALISLHHTALAMTPLDAASRVLLRILQAADERI